MSARRQESERFLGGDALVASQSYFFGEREVLDEDSALDEVRPLFVQVGLDLREVLRSKEDPESSRRTSDSEIVAGDGRTHFKHEAISIC